LRLRASEVVRLRAGDIDSEQKIIRIVPVEGTERPARDAASGGPEAVAAMVEGAADRVRRQRRARTKLAVSRSQ